VDNVDSSAIQGFLAMSFPRRNTAEKFQIVNEDDPPAIRKIEDKNKDNKRAKFHSK